MLDCRAQLIACSIVVVITFSSKRPSIQGRQASVRHCRSASRQPRHVQSRPWPCRPMAAMSIFSRLIHRNVPSCFACSIRSTRNKPLNIAERLICLKPAASRRAVQPALGQPHRCAQQFGKQHLLDRANSAVLLRQARDKGTPARSARAICPTCPPRTALSRSANNCCTDFHPLGGRFAGNLAAIGAGHRLGDPPQQTGCAPQGL